MWPTIVSPFASLGSQGPSRPRHRGALTAASKGEVGTLGALRHVMLQDGQVGGRVDLEDVRPVDACGLADRSITLGNRLLQIGRAHSSSRSPQPPREQRRGDALQTCAR